MTEGDWLESADPQEMLRFLQGKASYRKLLLFVCSCYRRVWGQGVLPEEPLEQLVEVAERFAEGQATRTELAAAREAVARAEARAGEVRIPGLETEAWAAAENVSVPVVEHTTNQLVLLVADSARRSPGSARRNQDSWESQAARHRAWLREESAVRRAQCGLLRELFGNPFRRVRILPAWRHANNRCVLNLARAVQETQQFGGLPILADALLDAGCDDEAMIAHCHSPLPHARGCWLLDALLGKT